jgi:hypothetical protein
MAVFSAYLDISDYVANATASIETASTLAGNTTLSALAALGATSLQVGSTAGFASSGTFTAWILDGANSERVVASVTDATHLAVPAGTAAQHASGVSVSSAGALGCLADSIARASAWIESHCRMGPDGGDGGLWQKSRTETYSGPSMRAAIDVDQTLLLRPYFWPVASVASMSIRFLDGVATALSLTNLTLPDGARTIALPYAQLLNTAPPAAPWYGVGFPRERDFWLTLTYTAGPIPGTSLSGVPFDIRQACMLKVSDLLARRLNPLGASHWRRGDVSYGFGGRGAQNLQSIHEIEACALLEQYTSKGGW